MHQTRLYMPTVKAIRKLKDGQGQYLWQPSLTAGTPDTLLNRPVYTSAYAPIIEATGTFFQTFKRAFCNHRAGWFPCEPACRWKAYLTSLLFGDVLVV